MNELKTTRALVTENSAELIVEPVQEAQLEALVGMENAYLAEIGEEPMTQEHAERLTQAIRSGRITFLIARRGQETVGMCSVSRCFSTFACADTGVFEDFYIRPAWRRRGVARRLACAAQEWCRVNGVASLTVCCAPCDEGMYQSLGFDVRLGSTYAKIG